MSDDQLRRIVIDLVDALMAQNSGVAGNWGQPLTSTALQSIKRNLLSLSDAAPQRSSEESNG